MEPIRLDDKDRLTAEWFTDDMLAIQLDGKDIVHIGSTDLSNRDLRVLVNVFLDEKTHTQVKSARRAEVVYDGQ